MATHLYLKYCYLECEAAFGGDLSDLEAVCILEVLGELHVLHLQRRRGIYVCDWYG